MKCPKCQTEIPEKLIAKHFASKGGSKSRRTLTTAQSRAMLAAREKKRLLIPDEIDRIPGPPNEAGWDAESEKRIKEAKRDTQYANPKPAREKKRTK